MVPCKLVVLIPALKKTVAFRDDLVKKLSGISLIQRAINKAYDLGVKSANIHLLTDSEEIMVIGKRNDIQVYYEAGLTWSENKYITTLNGYFINISKRANYVLLLSPYAPLLTVELIDKACQAMADSGKDILKPIKQVKRHIYDEVNQNSFQALFGDKQEIHDVESRSFALVQSRHFNDQSTNSPSILPWPVEHDLLEIESYQDWWVCEKLLNRKRLIFRVIGNKQNGMGHIYRALSLAHEITDHEILFVCDTENSVAVNKLTGYDYWLGIYEPDQVVDKIIELKPDLVVNDILSTTEADILPLQETGIKVVNFEDLGKGAKLADLTINELYDEPQYDSKNSFWGSQYFFVRDEFDEAKPHRFKKRVGSILLCFGGTDQHDLSYKVYCAIKELCLQRKITIHIVVGAGYINYSSLQDKVSKTTGVTLTQATGVMSSIMEKSHLAITSNGRTVYELAHMNIPAIVVSQHERETTHSFSCEENGFIPIGLFKDKLSEQLIVGSLIRLLDDELYRHQLFNRTKKYRFHSNKKKVLKKIYALFETKGD